MIFATERERDLMREIRQLRKDRDATRNGSSLYKELDAKIGERLDDLAIEREFADRYKRAIRSVNAKPGLSPEFYRGIKFVSIFVAIVLFIVILATGDFKSEGVATRLVWTVLVVAVSVYIFGYFYHKSARQ